MTGRRTEAATLDNEARLLGLLDSIDGVVYEYDVELDRFVFARGKAEALLGFPAQDWLEPGFWTARLHPEDRELAHGFCVQQIGARRDHQFEYRMLAHDGRTVWVHDHVTLVERDGRPAALRGVILDVTPRIAAERALRELKSRFANLLDDLSVGVLFEDAERRILFANQALCASFGLSSPAELVGRDCRAALAELREMFTDPEAAVARIESLIAARTPTVGEDVRLRDGRVFERRYIPVSPGGSFAGHLWQFLDVTDRRRTEDALRQSEGRHRAFLRSLPDLIFLLDAEGRFVDCHAPDPRLLLVPVERFIGRRVEDVLPPALSARFRGAFDATLASGEPQRFDDEIELAGERHLFEYRVLAIDDGRVSVIARDMTEQRRLEERLFQAQKLEGIGRLAGGVAHDFNNLLTGILSYAEIGEQEAASAATAEHFVRIRGAGERAAELTQQLLAFARKQIVRPRAVSPNGLVAEMLPFLRRVIGEHVRLETELAPDAGLTRIDPTQLSTVLMNLVVNARDALPDGGVARITTRNLSLAAGTPGLPPVECVELAVEDSGVGMDERTRAHVFEPFFTTKRVGAGTGMGLATCYGIVSQAGGSIQVESRVGKGTRVLVRLPRAHEDADHPEPPAEAPAPGRELVLLVEDEPLVRELAERALAAHGYEVLSAPDGPRALELARERLAALALLISDVVMPQMSGDELAARLRELRPGLPVLFVSGYAPRTDASPGEIAGAAFLRKPFTPTQLARKVRELLDARATP